MDLKITDIKAPNISATTQTTKAPEDKGFDITLGKVSEEKLMEKLRGLIDEITVQGKKLGEHMDVTDMKHYRALITEFIGEVVGNSHKFSRENFLDRRGRHRVYGLVKLINKDLDDLAQELIKAEKDHIAILDKTDEILGLLLDILI